MSQYIHQVPGRIRIRSTAVRCGADQALKAERRMLETAGVRQVRINQRAGSITVNYDHEQLTQAQVLGMLEELGCIGAVRESRSGIGDKFTKALAGALAQKAIEQSARTLIGALI